MGIYPPLDYHKQVERLDRTLKRELETFFTELNKGPQPLTDVSKVPKNSRGYHPCVTGQVVGLIDLTIDAPPKAKTISETNGKRKVCSRSKTNGRRKRSNPKKKRKATKRSSSKTGKRKAKRFLGGQYDLCTKLHTKRFKDGDVICFEKAVVGGAVVGGAIV